MSATGRGGERHPDDFYRTPAWCVHRLLDAVTLPDGFWLEPWAGDGAIVTAAETWFRRMERSAPTWVLNEMSSDRAPAGARVGDYRDWRMAGDVILSNPPYRDALECATWALDRAPVVALLLRLNWLEGASRAAWHHAHPASVYVLPNRPSFTGRGTDATAYAWFVWGLREVPTVRVLSVTERRER